MIIVDTREPNTVPSAIRAAAQEPVISQLLPWGDIWISPTPDALAIPRTAAELFALLPVLGITLDEMLQAIDMELPSLLEDAAGAFLAWLSSSCLVIESKTPGDFFNTWKGDRLDAQVMHMVARARYAMVMIKGSIAASRDTLDEVSTSDGVISWNYWAVLNKFVSLGLSGAPVVQVAPARYADFVVHLAAWYRKDPDLVRPPKPKTMVPLSKKAAFLCGLPGIGPKLATDVLKWTGDDLTAALQALTDPDVPKLENRPEGLGPGRIEANRRFLDLPAGTNLLPVGDSDGQTD